MPTQVRIKVTLLVAASLLPLILLGRDGFWTPFKISITVLYLIFGLYVAWCFWPRLKWGLQAEDFSRGFNGSANYALSFDDGPTPGLTDLILDLLKAYGQKASFFVLVSKAEKAPHLIQRMVNEGHAVGLHGWDHRKPFFQGRKRIWEHLSQAKNRLERLSGTQITLYRPSHGWKNWALARVIRDLGMKFCFWDYGVWDTDNPSLEQLKGRLLVAASQSPKQRPVTLLLHDGRGDAPGIPDHGQVMLDALKAFLDEKTRR